MTVPDIGAVAAPVGFLGALAGILTYLGNAIVADRGRLAEERDRADRLQDELDAEIRARRAAERDLMTAELELERLSSRLEGARERELDYQRAAHALRSAPS